MVVFVVCTYIVHIDNLVCLWAHPSEKRIFQVW